MNVKQVDILLAFQQQLLDSLTPEQYQAWCDHCAEHGEECDLAYGVTSLIDWIDENV